LGAKVIIIPAMRKRWMAIFFLIGVVALLATVPGCARGVRVASVPFVHSEVPADLPRLPLRVALVRTPAMATIPTSVGEKDDLGGAMARSAMRGLYDAARLVVTDVQLFDGEPVGDFDLVCTPTNPFFELRQNHDDRFIVNLTMEVIVRETRTGRERGLLLAAQGRPGRRPAVPIEVRSLDGRVRRRAGVTGALVDATYFEQAVNNALFHLSLDFQEKLSTRAAALLREP